MPDPISAIVIGGLSLFSAGISAEGATAAANAQSQASQSGIEEQRRQFNQTKELLRPYTEAGAPALEAQQSLLGLRGPDAEREAIGRISGGETFQALSRQGEESLLQRASATGGLRGGNIQGALSQFRPQLLSNLIDQQYGRLGGLTQMGQASAAGVGAAGMESGANIANLLAQQGAAQAGGIIGQANAYGNLLNMPLQFIGARYSAGGKF